MNHRNDHTEHQFDIWLDAYVAGRSTPASRAASDSVPGDIRDTARQFHGLAHGAENSPTLPPFAPTWEDFMSTNAAITHQNPGRTAELVPAHALHTASSPHSRLARAVIRWQPAVSLAVVIAFLVGLIGIAYQRGVLLDSGDPGMSQIGQGAATPTPLQPFGECESNDGTQLSDDDLRTMSITDWSVPAYVVAQPVPPDIGQQIASTYLGYEACLFERQEAGSVGSSQDELSYLSDRMRFELMYDTLSPEQQAEIDARRERSPIPRLISDFPLPLNRTDFNDGVALSNGVFIVDFFKSGDIYALPDGRYAAVIGGVSTKMLRTGQPIRPGDGELYFVAFTDQGGRFFIDESFPICPPDFATAAQEAGTAPPHRNVDAPVPPSEYATPQFCGA